MKHSLQHSVVDELKKYSWQNVSESIYGAKAEDVERVLQKKKLDLKDFAILLSPAAEGYLEPMAQKAKQLTRQRFGHAIQMYSPLYLSNECHNVCTYCGFSMQNEIPRKTLSDAEILEEARIIKSMGFDHILLVTGESNHKVGVDYLEHAIHLIRDEFAQISIEVQPLLVEEYEQLVRAGMSGVFVYQETYHCEEYKKHHPKGKKSIFDYRVETPDRLGLAKVDKVGLGALLGLEDWRVDSFFTGVHLDYLEKTYWQTRYSISFPRLRPHVGLVQPKVEISNRQLVQLITAWRLFKHEIDLSLSTRESANFRNGAASLGITAMSAASKTDPGGYAHPEQQNLEQFQIDDERTVAEVCGALEAQGLQPVFKDWDASYDV